ncbi:hypothetical protein QBC46DRAFT_344047 [Diplogelasinospora grovesii]|uniref:PARP catalytic domain-containing protein n=1 Tax=Diplogelasinospora grovesii TaxID=303347 RepID=A0AAN6S2E2_9PEZI|nr:hypothetical protein QBC46DRAFT_344047 [Diplogelasinospora grovesii]
MLFRILSEIIDEAEEIVDFVAKPALSALLNCDPIPTMAPQLKQLNPPNSEYKFYEKKFNDGWLHPEKEAEVQAIYLATKDDLVRSYRGRRFTAAMKAHGDREFRTRFHGTQRACHIGDHNGNLTLCRKDECHVCGILRHSFKVEKSTTGSMFRRGIYSTTASSKADIYAKNYHLHSHKHVMIICRVIANRPQLLGSADHERRGPDGGFNYVEAVPQSYGGDVKYPETIVYRDDDIIPVGLIIYTRNGWEA